MLDGIVLDTFDTLTSSSSSLSLRFRLPLLPPPRPRPRPRPLADTRPDATAGDATVTLGVPGVPTFPPLPLRGPPTIGGGVGNLSLVT